MDKNTIIGFIMIALILVGFSVMNTPSEEELARQQRYNDSIALVEKTKQQQVQQLEQQKSTTQTDSLTNSTDSLGLKDAFGVFDVAAKGENKTVVLENELVKLHISTLGGRIVSAELKNYKTHDAKPLILFNEKESQLGFTISTNNNRVVNTSALYFSPVSAISKDKNGNQTLTMRLNTSAGAYLDFVYTLPANDYMVGLSLKANAMNSVVPAGVRALDMQWASKIRQQEKGYTFEARYSQIHYKFVGDDVEKMSESSDDEQKLPTKVKWISYSGQFFSTIFIADDAFTSTNLKSVPEAEGSGYLKSYEGEMAVSFDPSGKTPTNLHMFFGPNQYKVLSVYDDELEGDNKLSLNRIIPLGWGIFGWVNRFAIIPMFNFFSNFISNFGIIILLMTLVIKLVLFPLTFKSYMSSAKMRVLKPEIDEINARIPAEKMAERQKATMELYGKVGVSPMSGCLPTLLQMPILFAMFSFFPAAIELRQESFLWADDLSSYDAIVSWSTNIPLISTYFGNHISLFTLLMTAVSILYTKLNMANTPTTDQMGGAMMKWMMYLMPVVFMFMFNSYASGLSYYYFIATLISISQTYLMRAFVDDKKIHAELNAKRNSKKPVKKSGFMERLEKMQREQEKRLKERK